MRVYGCGGVENSFELHWFEWFLRQPSGDILAAAEDAMRGVGNGEEWMDTKDSADLEGTGFSERKGGGCRSLQHGLPGFHPEGRGQGERALPSEQS